jgi:hypothetical protein
MVLVAAAAADDFSSGEIRFDERYFFRHPPAAADATADHTLYTGRLVIFSLYIFSLRPARRYPRHTTVLIDHCAHV